MHDYHDEEVLGKAYDARLMKRLLGYAKPYWKVLVLSIVMLLFVTCAELARPFLVAVAIDNHITPQAMAVYEAGQEPADGIEYQGRVYVPAHSLTEIPAGLPRAQILRYQGDYFLVGTDLANLKYTMEPEGDGLRIDSESGQFYAEPLSATDYRMFRQPDVDTLVRLAGFYLLIIVIGFGMNYVQIYLLHRTGRHIVYDIRRQVFAHLQRMSLRFFDTRPVGRLVTRVTNDTELLNQMFTEVLVNLFKDIFMLLGIILVMLRLNVRLALLCFALLPVMIVATVFFRIKARDAYREVRVRLARINAYLAENINGMRIVQIFHREKKKHRDFDQINMSHYKASFREMKIFAIFRPFIDIMYFTGVALLIWYGGGDVIRGTLEFGVLYAFINYVRMFFQPINAMAEKYNVLQAAMASSERIFELMDTPEGIKNPESGVKHKFEGSIEFRNVWLAYNPGEWVLKDVSFRIELGQTVAFVGATGAGKTSIINLLTRLYDIQQGQILIDGVDIKTMDLNHLRRNIAVVLQDVFMFSGTIADNIRLNNEEINDQQIREIAEAVDANKFIDQLPRAYQSEVTERGSTMSAGQRQLLAFARALAFNPSILVLDEATANIDTETEQIIQRAMHTISKGRTTLVVAHRLSTIQNADQIIVMHKGKVREIGNHQELLARGDYYYHLYQLQYKDQELYPASGSS